MTNRHLSGVTILAALTLIGSVAIYGGTSPSAIANPTNQTISVQRNSYRLI